jgi:ABC-type sugar transport system permease subunit
VRAPALKRFHGLRFTGYLFILPALTFYVAFIVVPIIVNVGYSLHDWDGASEQMTWVGLGNYRELARDPIFWKALLHNLLWIAASIALPVGLGLVLAALLSSEEIRIKLVFRVTYFIPAVLALTIVAYIWDWIYNPSFGVINSLLRSIGLGSIQPSWLGNEWLVLPSLIVAGSWTYYGFCMVVFLAAIQSISPEYYEVAVIEGASRAQMLVKVTIPLIRSVVTLVVINSLIGSFKVFDIVFLLTKGGPFNSSEVIATYMFTTTFTVYRVGYGAALAMALAAIIAAVTIFYLRVTERWE